MVAPLTSDDVRTVGPYQLLGQLGRGYLGDVFLGRPAGGETVAVKVIRPELASDPWFRSQFGAEVAAARQVEGAFVAPVVDADPDGDVPWLATAYVDGPTLAGAIRERGPVPAGALLMLACGLVEGLDAIHAAGVVHGNLHPSNVLLAEDGPRLADFGIARAAAASALPGEGDGWPGFSSPEQALGEEAGPASDIFSLGAVLTFACTGHGPFGSGSSAALMYRLVNSPAELDGLPDELRPLVSSCLAKHPGDRPAAGALLAEFRALRSRTDRLRRPMVTVADAAPRALALAGASAGEPWPVGGLDGSDGPGELDGPGGRDGRGGRKGSRRRESRPRGSRPPVLAWAVGGLLAVSAAVIVVMTGALPLPSAGQSQGHGTEALAEPAATSQAPAISGSSPSASSGSSPSASGTGKSGGITPSVQQGPSPSAFLSPAALPPSASAAASSAPASSASASPTKSASASPKPSGSPSPSHSPSPTSPAPSTPPPSSSAPSTPPPSSAAPSTPPPSSAAPSTPPPSSAAPSTAAPSTAAPSSAAAASPSSSASAATSSG